MSFENLQGASIYLRLVEETDADFICELRNSDGLKNYISPSTADAEQQRQWIKEYQHRYARGEEYYFIICRNSDDLPVGTARIYDLRDSPKSFRWGSWILNADKTKYAAIESAILIYRFGFEVLGCVQGRFEIMKENTHVQNFKTKMGSIPVAQDDTFIYYVLTKERFEADKSQYQKFLQS